MSLLHSIAKKALLIALLFNAIAGQSQTALSDSVFNKKVEQAIQKGDAELLTQLFFTKIDMTLPDKAGIFSKPQAKFVLSDFFKENTPESFNILNESKNIESNFTVGKLHTKNQHFRVCYLTKTINNQLFIYQLRIEK